MSLVMPNCAPASVLWNYHRAARGLRFHPGGQKCAGLAAEQIIVTRSGLCTPHMHKMHNLHNAAWTNTGGKSCRHKNLEFKQGSEPISHRDAYPLVRLVSINADTGPAAEQAL